MDFSKIEYQKYIDLVIEIALTYSPKIITALVVLFVGHVKIIIPNGDLSNGAIENLTNQRNRRHDLVYGIGYSDSIDDARKILLKIAKDHPEIIMTGEKAPNVFVSNLGDNAVELTLRVWCKTGDFIGLPGQINEMVKKTFDKEGISFPFPQRDVHLHNVK